MRHRLGGLMANVWEMSTPPKPQWDKALSPLPLLGNYRSEVCTPRCTLSLAAEFLG